MASDDTQTPVSKEQAELDAHLESLAELYPWEEGSLRLLLEVKDMMILALESKAKTAEQIFYKQTDLISHYKNHVDQRDMLIEELRARVRELVEEAKYL